MEARGGKSFEGHGGLPSFVVGVKGTAIAPSEQGGAVADLRGQPVAWKSGSGIGEGGKPGSKGGAIGGGVEAEPVRCAVS